LLRNTLVIVIFGAIQAHRALVVCQIFYRNISVEVVYSFTHTAVLHGNDLRLSLL